MERAQEISREMLAIRAIRNMEHYLAKLGPGGVEVTGDTAERASV
jgi:hypothetical protein